MLGGAFCAAGDVMRTTIWTESITNQMPQSVAKKPNILYSDNRLAWLVFFVVE